MADSLTTSSIASLVDAYKNAQQTKQVVPLNDRRVKYVNMNTSWTALQSKLSTLQTALSDLKNTDSTNTVFNTKAATTSNATFVAATASSSALQGSYTMRVNQLAKNDLAVSKTFDSATEVTDKAGTQVFKIERNGYTGNVAVELTGTETNSSILTKISNAVNIDKAIVASASKVGTDTFKGTGNFIVNLNGTETKIAYDYANDTEYSKVFSDITTQINKISGLTAEVVSGTSGLNLKVTVADNSQYITIDQSKDTGGLLSLANLNVSATKEKSAANLATASVFSPSTGKSKLSFSSNFTGLENKLTLSAENNTVLNFLGFTDSTRGVVSDTTGGFILTESQLNSKLTFNGVNVERSSNSFSDLASGVTLDIKAVMAATDADVGVGVSNSTASSKSKITDFITKYNDAYTYIKSRSNSNSTGKGLFVGDSIASGMLNSLRTMATSTINGLPSGNLSYLGSIGISFDPTSGLSISDDAALTSALSEKPSQVQAMFSSTNGIATKLYESVNNYISTSGSIPTLTATNTSNAKYLADKMTTIQDRIDKSAVVLRQRYEKLQTQLNKMISANNTWVSQMNSTMTSGY